jgi:hypothetical protein
MNTSYQRDVENYHDDLLNSNDRQSNSKFYRVLGVAALVMLSAGAVMSISSSGSGSRTTTMLASKVSLSPSSPKEKVSSKKVVTGPAGYQAALDYTEPCDALRKECCADTSFPVLGGMDVVHFRLTGEVAFGNPKLSAQVVGIGRTYTFWFSQDQYVSLFEDNIDTYLPKYGGFEASSFCDADGTLTDLLKETVQLTSAIEIDRHMAFTSAPVDSKTCDAKYARLYGIPTQGLFNTRCVSMTGLTSTTVGLALSTPLAALPTKMSQLYGIPTDAQKEAEAAAVAAAKAAAEEEARLAAEAAAALAAEEAAKEAAERQAFKEAQKAAREAALQGETEDQSPSSIAGSAEPVIDAPAHASPAFAAAAPAPPSPVHFAPVAAVPAPAAFVQAPAVVAPAPAAPVHAAPALSASAPAAPAPAAHALAAPAPAAPAPAASVFAPPAPAMAKDFSVVNNLK